MYSAALLKVDAEPLVFRKTVLLKILEGVVEEPPPLSSIPAAETGVYVVLLGDEILPILLFQNHCMLVVEPWKNAPRA